jgi:hypothetical protein
MGGTTRSPYPVSYRTFAVCIGGLSVVFFGALAFLLFEHFLLAVGIGLVCSPVNAVANVVVIRGLYEGHVADHVEYQSLEGRRRQNV